ncbi:MAG: hypothetical protein HKL92_05610 [Candidatus Eremiobacteraeota bacterium]|nr:hypothetical protein [Candidatus Eremiobacteraeota bacterium]NNM92802.1 hypothetical protein [Candidatus Eremiobacteraeota bacterium]
MRLLVRLARALVLCAGPAAVAACAGTVHLATGAVPKRLPNGATIRITIPKKSASGRGAQYVSPATTQMTIDIEQGGVAVSGYPQTIGLTPTSTGCTSTLANTLCQLSLALAPGAYTATISLLDASNNTLSSAQSVPFTVVAGTNNTIPIVLGGIPHAIDLTPVDAPNSIGPSGLAISSTGYGSATLTVVATPSNGSALDEQISALATTLVKTLAGSTTSGFTDGTGSAASFNIPTGISYHASNGDLYVTDSSNCAIPQVTTAGVVTTVAGSPGDCTFARGLGSSIDHPVGITYDGTNGLLYITDSNAIQSLQL